MKTPAQQFISILFILFSLLPSQLYAHKSKAWAALSNRFGNSPPTTEIEVEITWELSDGNSLMFFQVETADNSEILVPNSIALLQALNQALFFGAVGATPLATELPPVLIPEELGQRRTVALGQTTGADYQPRHLMNSNVRRYLAGNRPILTIVTLTNLYGSILNLVFLVFGNKKLYIYLYDLEEMKKIGKKDPDDKDHGHGQAGVSALATSQVNLVRSIPVNPYKVSNCIPWKQGFYKKGYDLPEISGYSYLSLLIMMIAGMLFLVDGSYLMEIISQ